MKGRFISLDRDAAGEVKATITSIGGLINTNYLSNEQEVYKLVPWLYRGATMRANTVSRVPWKIENEAGDDITEQPEYTQLRKWMTRNLYLAELSTVLYGAFYFLKESNRFRLNTNLRFVPAPYIGPQWDREAGEIQSFVIALTGSNGNVDPDRVVWGWLPNPFNETEPDVSPARVALGAAGMLAALDAMGTEYFKAGAVPITAIKVPPTTPAEEKKKLENWFTRLAGGFRNAFKFMAVNQGTEFETIGATPKDSQASELTVTQRDNVAVALGVPPSVIDGRSANYATANSEMAGFYYHTIIPECERIQEIFNAQIFEPLGVEFEFDKSALEIVQTAQLEQAATLKDLTGGRAIFTVNEARAWLDMPEMTPAEYDDANPKPTITPPPQFGASSATPAPDAEEPDEEEQMKAWLDLSLARLRAGIPATVGAPFDSELAAASSGKMVRGVFSAHWPRKSADWQREAVIELRRYNDIAAKA